MDLVITIITGLVLSIATAFVTVHLSLRRFRAERLWLRRVDAYQKVLEALHHASRDRRVVFARYVSQSEYEPTEAQQRKISAAYEEIYKAIDLGSFLLSDEAATCLKKLEKSLREASQKKEDYYSYLEDTEIAVNECLKTLQDIAKEDVKKLRI